MVGTPRNGRAWAKCQTAVALQTLGEEVQPGEHGGSTGCSHRCACHGDPGADLVVVTRSCPRRRRPGRSPASCRWSPTSTTPSTTSSPSRGWPTCAAFRRAGGAAPMRGRPPPHGRTFREDGRGVPATRSFRCLDLELLTWRVRSWGVGLAFRAGQITPAWSDPPVGSPGPESIVLPPPPGGPERRPGPRCRRALMRLTCTVGGSAGPGTPGRKDAAQTRGNGPAGPPTASCGRPAPPSVPVGAEPPSPSPARRH